MGQSAIKCRDFDPVGLHAGKLQDVRAKIPLTVSSGLLPLVTTFT